MSTMRTFDNNYSRLRSGATRRAQITAILREAIISGRYEFNEALPGEDSLARSFNVSRTTLRHALSDLESAGYIERRHGLGTFVRRAPAGFQFNVPMSAAESEIDRWKGTTARVYEFEYVRPPDDIAALLQQQNGQLAQRSVRVRALKGHPLIHLTTYVPEDVGRTYTAAELRKKTLRSLLERAGRGYRTGEQTISATLADPLVASWLDIQVGSALLLIQRLLRDANGRPVEYLEIRASSERYRPRMTFEADTDRPNGMRLLDFSSTF
jgi:GntR family transcriptional regulator